MKNIAVVYGGYSSEHQISVLSGKYVASIIDNKIFNVYPILISQDSWQELNSGMPIDKNDFSVEINGKKTTFDAIVNVIHGNPGENGILQSYFEMLGIPFTGCNALASALTFNKYYCNNYLRNFNLNIAQSIIVRKDDDFQTTIDEFVSQVGLPVFVKPSNGGSSFGITKVKNIADLIPAIYKAYEESDEVIIEQFIKGREFTCGVYKTDKINALTPIEIKSKHEFFDYESKYNSNLNEEIIPAPIDQNLTNICKETSATIYQLLNCDGIIRVDYILDEKTQKFYFLEVNTIPGMTSESLVPKMLRYDKIDISTLYTELINKLMKK